MITPNPSNIIPCLKARVVINTNKSMSKIMEGGSQFWSLFRGLGFMKDVSSSVNDPKAKETKNHMGNKKYLEYK